jgi:3-oxoacyl-[acyl-carrier protein] reductase
MDLNGKVAIVTGGSKGIGRGIAETLVRAGANVCISARSRNEINETVRDLRALKTGNATGIVSDVCNYSQVNPLFELTVSEFGGLDILVNNAGMTRDNLFMRMKNDEWDDVIAVNLTAAFRLSRSVLRGMMKQRFGRIISISSVVGVMGHAGQANYAASKAGLIAMGKSLAQEVAQRNITVNTIAPGFIVSGMTDVLNDKQHEMILDAVPMARMGTAEEIAGCAVFLASDAAAYITGQTLNVNGGMAMI